MIDQPTILSWSFVLLIVVVAIALWIFKDKLKAWDRRLSESLHHAQAASNSFWYPSATYRVTRTTHQGHMLSTQEFSCVGFTLQESLEGINILLAMSDRELEEESNESPKDK